MYSLYQYGIAVRIFTSISSRENSYGAKIKSFEPIDARKIVTHTG